ncbi:MAG: HAD family hydrolase [Dehalococcoidia bacterium]|nr:HAD family hydrolase [Dehalococcoidia bacterium]
MTQIVNGRIKVISFDAEGTLVTPDFTYSIWSEAIPSLYAQKKEIEFAQAKKIIVEEYDKVSDQRPEWYDIKYWFDYLGLGSPDPVIRSCQNRLSYYPEVAEVLSSLACKYELIVASGTPVELLRYLLQDVKHYFAHVFSSTSHYRQLKNPDFYLAICETMAVEPSEVVHVGDNWQFDFLNAKQAGIHTFHLDRSGSNHESLADLTQLKSDLLA